MTWMTRPDCAVMCNLINTHTHTHTHYTSLIIPFIISSHFPRTFVLYLYFCFQAVGFCHPPRPRSNDPYPYDLLYEVGAFDTTSRACQQQYCSIGVWTGDEFDKDWLAFFYFFLLAGKVGLKVPLVQFNLSFRPLIIKYDIKRAGFAIRRMRKSHSQPIAYLAIFFPKY